MNDEGELTLFENLDASNVEKVYQLGINEKKKHKCG